MGLSKLTCTSSYAKIQREQERQGLTPEERGHIAASAARDSTPENASGDEKTTEKAPAAVSASAVTATEWETASRATRNASWIQM